jgi:thiol-disulfide isomerase/thioredoxin
MKRCLVILLVLAVWLPGAAGAADGRGTLGEILAGLPAVQGAALSSRDLDDRVVLVAFFASWCPPCQHEFPHLNTMQEAYGDDGLQIVAVNVFETHDGLSTPAKLKAFLDLTRPIFPILKGDAETRRVFGDLDRIPTMFLFARDGTLSFVFRHERNAEKTHLSEAELREAIEPLL